VLANAAELEQVFLNLLLNALDAMPHGGRLTVGAAALPAEGDGEGGWVELHVADTGAGIDPAIRGRVFQPFLTTKRDGRGSGLGLSICQGLVRSHGGEITLESRRGGTRALVRLPSLTVVAPSAATPTREIAHA
jgi:two-component system, NtrC family, sensor kinase